jgi:hypothetical protein
MPGGLIGGLWVRPQEQPRRSDLGGQEREATRVMVFAPSRSA